MLVFGSVNLIVSGFCGWRKPKKRQVREDVNQLGGSRIGEFWGFQGGQNPRAGKITMFS